MALHVVSLADRISDRSIRSEWTNAELAELYRVEHALVQARISIETDRGVTDEGDPWFVFCRADGEVVVHIARFGGNYRLFSPALPKPLVGPTFSALTRAFLDGLRTSIKPGDGVSIHPTALLSVLVAAIFFSIDFHSSAAHAADALGHGVPEHLPHPALGQLPAKDTIFQTLVANLKAFIDSVTPWDSQQSALLATVENAAVAAMSPLAGLAESATNVPSMMPVPVDTPEADRANNAFSPNGHKTATALQIDLKALIDRDSVVADRQNGAQAGGTHSQESILTWQGNQFSTPTGAITELTLLPAKGLQFVADGAQQDGSAFLAPDHSMLPTMSGQADALSAGIASLADKSVAPSADNAVQVSLAQEPQSINLSALVSVVKIDVAGDGALHIVGINGAPVIDVGANFTQSLSLSFSANSRPAVTIQLSGHDTVTLTTASTDPTVLSNAKVRASQADSTSAASVNLTLDSEGNSANSVTIADNAVPSTTKLDIAVVGVQDLTLSESAQTFSNSNINSSNLTGALTVSLDLGNVFQSVDLSQVSAANFIVGDSGNIALLNASAGSHIQLGTDLNIVDLSIAGATEEEPGSLAVDLQSTTTNVAPVSVNLLDAFSTATLTINSTGTGPGGSNVIGTLTDASLATLTITGDSGLSISTINGPLPSDAQNITIDAHALSGPLVLDVSGIADTTAAGRSITIMAGAGTSILTNETASENTIFVAGTGRMTVNVDAGAIHDTISGAITADVVNVGAATYADVVVDGTTVARGQATIDTQTNVTAAAELAASLAASTDAHQALLFNYDGSLYVFVNSSGNHLFDASSDAIIKLVGFAATVNLTGVFHSA